MSESSQPSTAGHDGAVDASRAVLLRDLLASSPLIERTRGFGRLLTTSTRDPGGLLLVGTPTQEPWHLAAHLDDESQYAGLAVLRPTLVRYDVPANAPAHLSVTMARLERAGRGETVFVVAPDEPPEGLLQRAWDARRSGATVLALDEGSSELEQVAHESLTVGRRELLPDSSLRSDQVGANADAYELTESGLLIPSFDTVQHLVSVAAGEAAAAPGRRGLRDRLARMLDAISGPANPQP
jgi:hypothetical protein